VGVSDRLKQHIVVGYFLISVGGIGKLIGDDFSLGVLVYLFFLFGVLLEI